MSRKHTATGTLPSQPAKKRRAPAKEDEPTNHSPNLVDLANGGDVLLIVGSNEDKLTIKVSGKVLSLASEVFTRMLSSNFIEARTREIEMKDDDPNIVLEFCKVLHFDYSGVKAWDGRQMALIAEMATMKGCLHVFTPHIRPRLPNLIRKVAEAAEDPVDSDQISEFLQNEGLTMEHVVKIASKLNLDELFQQTVKLAIVQRPSLMRLESLGAEWNTASAAFAAMLTSGFKVSNHKEISLPEEDPDVMLDFFNVIHGKEQKGDQRYGQLSSRLR